MVDALSDRLTGSLLLTKSKRIWCSRKGQEMSLGKGLENSMCHQRFGYSGGEFSMSFSRQKLCCISAMLSRRHSVMSVERTANQSSTSLLSAL